MSEQRKIENALISVYYKDKLDEIINKLDQLGVKMYSTGGTQRFIEEMGKKVIPVEQLTSYPSILGGRVKTLHPKVFGGILGRRFNADDLQQMKDYNIPKIDLVIVDLYPFEETVASGAKEEDIIEKIDIGGIALIRAAAKNFTDVLTVSGRSQYAELLEILNKGNGITEIEDRRRFAIEGFNTSSHYDTQIFNYFNSDKERAYKISVQNGKKLRYGENPHQEGYYFGNFDSMFERIQGKEISYNNLLDIDAALNLINEFSDNTVAILKHNNACGVATRKSIVDAWNDALAADPVSAFGGIIITNGIIDRAAAIEMDKIFFEVVIAPIYEPDALEILMKKKNRIILVMRVNDMPLLQSRSILNGILVQDRDLKTETADDMRTVTNKQPSKQELADLVFANKVVKQSKSNTIVLAKNNMLLASGVGQTSRVDALRHAIAKAKSFGFSLEGAVMASDAFFPFPDCIEIASTEKISAVVQPGGSIKDNDSIESANSHGMAMVFTGIRHFKH